MNKITTFVLISVFLHLNSGPNIFGREGNCVQISDFKNEWNSCENMQCKREFLNRIAQSTNPFVDTFLQEIILNEDCHVRVLAFFVLSERHSLDNLDFLIRYLDDEKLSCCVRSTKVHFRLIVLQFLQKHVNLHYDFESELFEEDGDYRSQIKEIYSTWLEDNFHQMKYIERFRIFTVGEFDEEDFVIHLKWLTGVRNR